MRARTQIDQFRRLNNQELPSWYRWHLHLGANAMILIIFMACAFKVSPACTLTNISLFSCSFLAWSLIEYLIHRFVLHGRIFSSTRLYQQHSINHHSYFNHQFMTLEQPIDLNRVILFTSDLLNLIGLNAALAWAWSLAAGLDAGILFFLAGIAYLVAYEVAHGICHLAGWTDFSFARFFANHHRLHHRTEKTTKKNFSIVIPVWDLLLGSYGGE